MVLRVRTVRQRRILALVPQRRVAPTMRLQRTVAELLPTADPSHRLIQAAQDPIQRRGLIRLRAAFPPRKAQLRTFREALRISLVEVRTSPAVAMAAAVAGITDSSGPR